MVLSLCGHGGNVPVLDPVTGNISVPAGTTGGLYTIEYRICEVLNPLNCDNAFVTIDGTPLQKSFRPNLRPFNKEELARILRIGQCLPCHKEYSDVAYKNYSPNRPCPIFKE